MLYEKDFEQQLIEENLSANTIKNYLNQVKLYDKWYTDSYGSEFNKLYRMNILEYRNFLLNIKRNDGKTINAKLSAILKYNLFLVEHKIQDDIVISKADYIKIQKQSINPCIITKKEVEEFRQKVLEGSGIRNYVLVTILAYAGLRISECIDLRISDVDLVNKEIRVTKGKGKKQRIVYIGSKIVDAVKEYLKVHPGKSEYLFPSRESEKIDKSVINKMIKKYSNKITPHQLRHFFCSNALEEGYSSHEVANQAGHASLYTTSLYTNPSKEKMKEKADRL